MTASTIVKQEDPFDLSGRFTTVAPETKEIDAEEGITEHGIQLYVLDAIGWKHRAFITHLEYRGIDFSAGVVQWASARGWIRVDGLYRPTSNCILDGALLIQARPGEKKRVIRERRFPPINASKNIVGEINMTVRYE